MIFYIVIRAYQILNITENITETFQIIQRFPTEQALIKLFLLIMYIAHICACGFILITRIDNKPYNWLSH